MAGLWAFLASPVGQALVATAPQLIAEILATLHKSGALTVQDFSDHFNILVPEIAEQPK